MIGKHQRDAWPESGWSLTNLSRRRIKEFYKLYVPSALAIASDFWRVTVIGIIAARQGSLEVAIFNVGYRFLWICLLFSGALARAAGIKIAVAVGENAITTAKYISKVYVLILSMMIIVTNLF